MPSQVRAQGLGLRAKNVAQPLLKWAGGKRQLLPVLRRFYPAAFNTYFEPFLGSGAVFFDLHAQGLLQGHRAVLTDNNPDLIACYSAVRDKPARVVTALTELARGHALSGSDYYYDVRDKRFNPQRRTTSSDGGRPLVYTAELAAMFIYLNRTGYNGLFRLNSNGEFNVPAGRYSNPRICDAENVHRVSAALQEPAITLAHRRFDSAAGEASAGDFVYFDPPYAPLSRTARFTSYTAGGFTSEHQAQLRDIVITLARQRCHVLLSNSTAPEITELYARSQDVSAAGLRCLTVPARRSINSNADRRGAVKEYVITNIPP